MTACARALCCIGGAALLSCFCRVAVVLLSCADATVGRRCAVQVWDLAMRDPPPPLFQSFIGHIGAVVGLIFPPYVVTHPSLPSLLWPPCQPNRSHPFTSPVPHPLAPTSATVVTRCGVVTVWCDDCVV
jgi:hypothetical protein